MGVRGDRRKETIVTKKQVWRYQCDFCGKRKYSAPAMGRHERHCTLNPNRVCRVCKMSREGFVRGEADQPDLKTMIAILPDPGKYIIEDEHGQRTYLGLGAAVELVIPALREAAQNCPACIMAALRQRKIPVPMVESFDYKNEMEAVWAAVNEEQMQAREAYY